jgi:hypothetical protein
MPGEKTPQPAKTRWPRLPPVNALTITNSGGNRGISVSNSATSNASSALYGETYGAGAALTGFNYGTTGQRKMITPALKHVLV